MSGGQAPAFTGRPPGRATLDGIWDRVREGDSAVLVVRGEAGISKTALVHYCAREASECRVAQVAGVETELEMHFPVRSATGAPVAGTPGVSRVAGVADVPESAEVLVDDHVVVQLADILTGGLVDMAVPDLANGTPAHVVDVATAAEADALPLAL